MDSRAAASRRRRSSGASALGVRALAPAELALAEAVARQQGRLHADNQKRVAAFERALADLEADEVAALAAVAAQRAAAQQELAATEAAAEAARAAHRTQLLTGLRSQHQQKAVEGQRRVQQLEAAVRQQQEAAAAAAAAAAASAKAAAERQAAVATTAKAQAQQAAAAAQQQAAADQATAHAAAAAAEKKQAAAAAVATQASGLRIAPSAAEWERQCAEALAAAQVGGVCFERRCCQRAEVWKVGRSGLVRRGDAQALAKPSPSLPLPARTRRLSSRLWRTAQCATRSAPLTSLPRSTCSRCRPRWSRWVRRRPGAAALRALCAVMGRRDRRCLGSRDTQGGHAQGHGDAALSRHRAQLCPTPPPILHPHATDPAQGGGAVPVCRGAARRAAHVRAAGLCQQAHLAVRGPGGFRTGGCRHPLMARPWLHATRRDSQLTRRAAPPPPPYSQVTRLHPFAFPLGEVAVAVMAAHPDLVPLLAARLHQARLEAWSGGHSLLWCTRPRGPRLAISPAPRPQPTLRPLPHPLHPPAPRTPAGLPAVCAQVLCVQGGGG